ncbi:hypothetical protein PpBr36_03817 [Pyricularia pennisetigena]|uniref:hypothetical protein n=1 Tax=Pyricularia pennisetigena TaxID=1578925 RepID=UPI00114F9D90|nr:hypothetical protein PpBr36_03817 [Pyricularia pennisetigena]TLS31104.1 hypothetical protein PpBr36_03817 [Pyricularia pennisetigena]
MLYEQRAESDTLFLTPTGLVLIDLVVNWQPTIILCLTSVALAATPAILYRGDSRSPTVLQGNGGFKSYKTDGRLTPNTIDKHIYDMVEGGANLISFTKSATIAESYVEDVGYLYAIDPAGIDFADAQDYLRDDARKDMLMKDEEWLTQRVVPFEKIIGWKKVDGLNAEPAWTKNDAYTGAQCLTKRGLTGGGCALPLPQNPATTQQRPLAQQRPPTKPTTPVKKTTPAKQTTPTKQKAPTQQRPSTAGRTRTGTAGAAPAANNRVMAGRVNKASRRVATSRPAAAVRGF